MCQSNYSYNHTWSTVINSHQTQNMSKELLWTIVVSIHSCSHFDNRLPHSLDVHIIWKCSANKKPQRTICTLKFHSRQMLVLYTMMHSYMNIVHCTYLIPSMNSRNTLDTSPFSVRAIGLWRKHPCSAVRANTLVTCTLRISRLRRLRVYRQVQ